MVTNNASNPSNDVCQDCGAVAGESCLQRHDTPISMRTCQMLNYGIDVVKQEIRSNPNPMHTFIVRVAQRTDLPDSAVDAEYVRFILAVDGWLDVVDVEEMIVINTNKIKGDSK